MVPTLVLALTLAVAFWFPIRRWMARWATTSSDLTRVMAGDSLVVNPTFSHTMAIIVNARPEHIWPRLVQMGYQRPGLHSGDWLDRLFGFLDRPSATRRGWPVAATEPRRALVLDVRNMSGFDWVWQFGLYAVDEERTRLVARSQVRPQTVWAWLFAVFALEPGAFLMTRRTLLGLKERAEALAAVRGESSVRAA